MLTAITIVLCWLLLDVLFFACMTFGRWTNRLHHEIRELRRLS
jgi:hypothetical protein